jgi:hypothetical protein
MLRGPEFLYTAGSLLIIALGDICSVFCGVFLILRRGMAARGPADGGLCCYLAGGHGGGGGGESPSWRRIWPWPLPRPASG